MIICLDVSLERCSSSAFYLGHHYYSKMFTAEPLKFSKCQDQYKYFQNIFITHQKTKTPFNRLIKQKAAAPRYDRPHIPQLGTAL